MFTNVCLSSPMSVCHRRVKNLTFLLVSGNKLVYVFMQTIIVSFATVFNYYHFHIVLLRKQGCVNFENGRSFCVEVYVIAFIFKFLPHTSVCMSVCLFVLFFCLYLYLCPFASDCQSIVQSSRSRVGTL